MWSAHIESIERLHIETVLFLIFESNQRDILLMDIISVGVEYLINSFSLIIKASIKTFMFFSYFTLSHTISPLFCLHLTFYLISHLVTVPCTHFIHFPFSFSYVELVWVFLHFDKRRTMFDEYEEALEDPETEKS